MTHHLITRYPTRHEVAEERLPWPKGRRFDQSDNDLDRDRSSARFWWLYLSTIAVGGVAVLWWSG